jgi:hypothetical protein
MGGTYPMNLRAIGKKSTSKNPMKKADLIKD